MEQIDATKYSKLEKLVMPADMEPLKHIDIPYSALDHTRHVNNAEYMKWICDAIPEICNPRSTGRREISEFEINYLKETKYSDTETILYQKKIDDYTFFQLTNSFGISVNAKVLLK